MSKLWFLPVLLFAIALLPLTAESSPILRINTQMHTEAINDIAVDAAEKLVLTCSADKTARLWDCATGELLHILRPSIDDSAEGVLLAGTLTADGRTAVVGGSTTGNNLIFFDTSSGTIVNQVELLYTVVTDIQFSSDGRWLAIGHANDPTVIYSTRDWKVAKTLDSFGESTKLAFDSRGYLVVVGMGNIIRVYDPEFNLVDEATFSADSAPVSVAINPDQTRVAVCFQNNPLPVVLAYPELSLLYQPDTSELIPAPNALINARFSVDGSKLVGVGNMVSNDGSGNKWTYRVWESEGQGAYRDYPVADFSIIDFVPLNDGGLVYGSASPDWGRIDASGNTKYKIRAETYDFEDLGVLHVEKSSDEIGYTPVSGEPLRFQFAKRLLTTEESTEPTYIDSLPGLEITEWFVSQEPKLNGEPFGNLHSFEYCSSVDIVPDLGYILLGGSYSLNCLDFEGNVLWENITLTMVMDVKAAPQSQVAVAAILDGTIRWYDLANGNLLLTLFVHRDRQQWILYTPSGYYDCSPGSENLIGWHVNQPGKEALFYPVGRFRGTYYRPDVIDRILLTRNEEEAVRLANIDAGITEQSKSIDSILPPVVSIISPQHNSTFGSSKVNLEYQITSLNNEPVTSLRVLLDGRPFQTLKGKDIPGNSGSIGITLPDRNLRVGLIAENRFGKSEMAEVKLLWQNEFDKMDDEEKAEELPNLYVLVIGINDYQVQELKLRYSAKDATDFANTIKLQDDLMYENVTLKVLTNEQATRENILDGLDWLQEQCASEDVAMIFLSGHGANDKVGQFYYLPVGADISRMKSSCIPFSDFENTLSAIPGKVILFADACHSGGIYTDSQVRMPDLNRFINELSSPEVGVVIFTSSTPRQRSLESADWENGAFTKALVEGLTGAADFKNKGRISIKALDFYISDRVRELTANRQTPTTIIPQSIPDFDIGMVP